MALKDRPGLDRRLAWLTAIAASAALVLYALTVVPWDWVPNGDLTPMPAHRLFTQEQIARAEEFSGYRRLLSWSAYGVSLTVVGLLGFTRLGSHLIRRLPRALPGWLQASIATFLLLLFGRVIVLPFSLLLRNQSLEYGLTTQPFGAWLSDLAKNLVVGWVMTTIVVLLLLGFARRYPRCWFLPAGALAAVLTIVGSFLYPVLVEPMFNDFRSMPPGPLRSSVLELADRESVQVDDVLIADASQRTTTLNAYVSGFGSTRRVVVYDTLLAQMPSAEAKVVIAHELAHAKNRDVLAGTIMGALAAVAGISMLSLVLDSRQVRSRIGVRDAGEPVVVAFLLAAFALGSFFASPAMSSVSRAVEIRADRQALQVTGNSRAFVAMQRQLALKAIQDPTPPALSQFWFGSHPTVLQRAGLPQSMEDAK